VGAQRTVVAEFAEALAAAGVKLIYGIAGRSPKGVTIHMVKAAINSPGDKVVARCLILIVAPQARQGEPYLKEKEPPELERK
jgi:hypothetical protein